MDTLIVWVEGRYLLCGSRSAVAAALGANAFVRPVKSDAGGSPISLSATATDLWMNGTPIDCRAHAGGSIELSVMGAGGPRLETDSQILDV